MYQNRKEACERINDLFGLNIDVEINRTNEQEVLMEQGVKQYQTTHTAPSNNITEGHD